MITEFERLLEQLTDVAMPDPSATQICLLSGLPRGDVERVREVWEQIPLKRRRKVVRRMAELAEENIELNFDSIFRACLDDPDGEVRVVGVGGLWECESVDLVPPFVRLLEHDESPLVRAAAAEGLGRFLLLSELGEINAAVGMMAEQALLSAVHTPTEDREVRRRAIESLAYSSETGVEDIIEDAYHHADRKMRVSAIFAMGRSADIRWRGIVGREVLSPDPEIRFEAVQACGELEHVGALPRLFELVDDDDVEVRQAAIWAIGRIGGHEARRVLTRLLEHPDEATSQVALEALELLQFQMEVDVPLFDSDDELAGDFLEEDDFGDQSLRDSWAD